MARFPDVPIMLNRYYDLPFFDDYICVVADEKPNCVVEMTDELFLEVLLLCKNNNWDSFFEKNLQYKYVFTPSGLCHYKKYFEQFKTEIRALFSVYELWLLHVEWCGCFDYIDIISKFILEHEELTDIIGDELQSGARIYQNVIVNPMISEEELLSSDEYSWFLEKYPDINSFELCLDEAILNLGMGIYRDYLSLEPCDTLAVAMWLYGFKRLICEGATYKKCSRNGCKKYFFAGPSGQLGRKYCSIHLA